MNNQEQDYKLTDFELGRLNFLAQGLTDTEIFEQSGTRRNTINSTKKRIQEKMGVNNISAAILKAIKAELLGIICLTCDRDIKFSDAEYQLMKHFSDGLSREEVSSFIGVGIDTILKRENSIIKKMSAKTINQAVAVYEILGLNE